MVEIKRVMAVAGCEAFTVTLCVLVSVCLAEATAGPVSHFPLSLLQFITSLYSDTLCTNANKVKG